MLFNAQSQILVQVANFFALCTGRNTSIGGTDCSSSPTLGSILVPTLAWEPDLVLGMRLGREILSESVRAFGTQAVVATLHQSSTTLDWKGLERLVISLDEPVILCIWTCKQKDGPEAGHCMQLHLHLQSGLRLVFVPRQTHVEHEAGCQTDVCWPVSVS